MGAGASAGVAASLAAASDEDLKASLERLSENDRKRILEALEIATIPELTDPARFVAHALEQCGWDRILHEDIVVKDYTQRGASGARIYKVSVPGQFDVCFRAGDNSAEKGDPDRKERHEAACQIFSKHGCGPERLAQGEDWLIERWEGKPVGTSVFRQRPENPVEILTLVAKDSPDRCVFERASELKSTAVPMTLSSHPSKAVCLLAPEITFLPDQAESTSLLPLAVGDAKDVVCLKCEDQFLAYDDNGKSRVLCLGPWVADGNPDEVGHPLWLACDLMQSTPVDTVKGDAATERAYVVNDDGTIALKHSKAGLVLGVQEKYAPCSLNDLAVLLCRMHRIPVQWFDSPRERLCRKYPALASTSHGSWLWFYACTTHAYRILVNFPEEAMRKWMAAEPVPLTKAGSRIVTSHGDFHGGNIVATSKGLKAIDLETAYVGAAVQDLACAFVYWLQDSGERREFSRLYLEAMGDDATPDDVEALMLDVEIARIGLFRSVNSWFEEGIQLKRVDPSGECRITLALCAIGREAQHDKDLRTQILDKGLRRCTRGVEAIARVKAV